MLQGEISQSRRFKSCRNGEWVRPYRAVRKGLQEVQEWVCHTGVKGRKFQTKGAAGVRALSQEDVFTLQGITRRPVWFE